ncbi:hypothetical protein KEJ15_01740 [Candidatus Bathyarchaeota archaeon]|nr:hypothetical protein [Candidatus Bathyarchaeota archaeon]
MTISDLVRLLASFAEVAFTVVLVYVAFKMGRLVDALSKRIKNEKED